MPQRDRTGPEGLGPRTGRGRGSCAGRPLADNGLVFALGSVVLLTAASFVPALGSRAQGSEHRVPLDLTEQARRSLARRLGDDLLFARGKSTTKHLIDKDIETFVDEMLVEARAALGRETVLHANLTASRASSWKYAVSGDTVHFVVHPVSDKRGFRFHGVFWAGRDFLFQNEMNKKKYVKFSKVGISGPIRLAKQQEIEKTGSGSRGVQRRPLYEIHDEIVRNWKNVYFAAVPYLEAFRYLDKVTDSFMAESGRSVVTYFLSNATSWRGDVAKRVKAELRAML
jgi:hypothetical protein